jgi:hypothetical protein
LRQESGLLLGPGELLLLFHVQAKGRRRLGVLVGTLRLMGKAENRLVDCYFVELMIFYTEYTVPNDGAHVFDVVLLGYTCFVFVCSDRASIKGWIFEDEVHTRPPP